MHCYWVASKLDKHSEQKRREKLQLFFSPRCRPTTISLELMNVKGHSLPFHVCSGLVGHSPGLGTRTRQNWCVSINIRIQISELYLKRLQTTSRISHAFANTTNACGVRYASMDRIDVRLKFCIHSAQPICCIHIHLDRMHCIIIIDIVCFFYVWMKRYPNHHWCSKIFFARIRNDDEWPIFQNRFEHLSFSEWVILMCLKCKLAALRSLALRFPHSITADCMNWFDYYHRMSLYDIVLSQPEPRSPNYHYISDDN